MDKKTEFRRTTTQDAADYPDRECNVVLGALIAEMRARGKALPAEWFAGGDVPHCLAVWAMEVRRARRIILDWSERLTDNAGYETRDGVSEYYEQLSAFDAAERFARSMTLVRNVSETDAYEQYGCFLASVDALFYIALFHSAGGG